MQDAVLTLLQKIVDARASQLSEGRACLQDKAVSPLEMINLEIALYQAQLDLEKEKRNVQPVQTRSPDAALPVDVGG